jgi:RecJ-like exonuclease
VELYLCTRKNDWEVWFELPFSYQTCPTCNGRGKHVNPSIDCHGISAEEFHEDPDFMEEYLTGRYDVTCYGCDGKRVVPVPDESRMTPKEKKRYDKWLSQQAERDEFRRIQESERRMGA